jgi:hypothetical protein
MTNHYRPTARCTAIVLMAFFCGACGGAPPAPADARPSPTIAAFIPTPTTIGPIEAPAPAPTITPLSAPTPAPPRIDAGAATTGDETPFAYLWPEYLPAGMQLAPAESRIAREGEIGAGEIGFFILTFNAEDRKLVIGGGAADPFALSGQIQAISIAGRSARLVESGEQRQIVFEGVQGSLFVLGVGLSLDDLQQVAGALTPIDVGTLRARAGEE